jgi:hypothetical protein
MFRGGVINYVINPLLQFEQILTLPLKITSTKCILSLSLFNIQNNVLRKCPGQTEDMVTFFCSPTPLILFFTSYRKIHPPLLGTA